jgi:hypothetical protein
MWQKKKRGESFDSMKKYALRQVRINDRDRKVFEALYRFNGITLGALQEVHFNGSSYASNRLAKLKNAGYLDRKYYYSDGLKEAGVYYLCSKGIQEIGKEITPKYIEPRKDKLDVQIMLSKLYCKFSDDLLSAREVKQVYNLQNFTPISAFLPSPPTAIIILSQNSTSQEYNNVKTFLEAQVEPFVQYIVVAKKFPGVLEETDAHFIYWDMAEQVIPNFYRNPQHYTNSFLKVFQNYFPNTPITVKKQYGLQFHVANLPFGPLYLGELHTGFLRLARLLQRPDRAYCLSVPDRAQLNMVRVVEGSFTIYSEKDQAFYRVFTQDNRLKTKKLTLYELEIGQDLPLLRYAH